ncbi:hypothetical protein ACQPZZ_27670 [Microbispora sp. CA-135349]|uniref:hypothetical protein n=1 Tax=Microbispora sp. CA-135349 TaxID=3239953 RepID=UPI003D8DB8E3
MLDAAGRREEAARGRPSWSVPSRAAPSERERAVRDHEPRRESAAVGAPGPAAVGSPGRTTFSG